MSEDGDKVGSIKSSFTKFLEFYVGIVDKPVTWFREKVQSVESKNNNVYYHQKFRRVPTIDQCEVDDEVCFYEANEQYKRDRLVDTEILNILRMRKLECEYYYGGDKDKYCTKLAEDYDNAENNWFVKYGELGAQHDVRYCYMKQKHRMIWERRHGPVGSGMRRKEEWGQ